MKAQKKKTILILLRTDAVIISIQNSKSDKMELVRTREKNEGKIKSRKNNPVIDLYCKTRLKICKH